MKTWCDSEAEASLSCNQPNQHPKTAAPAMYRRSVSIVCRWRCEQRLTRGRSISNPCNLIQCRTDEMDLAPLCLPRSVLVHAPDPSRARRGPAHIAPQLLKAFRDRRPTRQTAPGRRFITTTCSMGQPSETKRRSFLQRPTKARLARRRVLNGFPRDQLPDLLYHPNYAAPRPTIYDPSRPCHDGKPTAVRRLVASYGSAIGIRK